MVSDTVASYTGIILGIMLAVIIIKWVKPRHIYFTVLFMAGAAIAAVGAMFLAWPLTHHIAIPMFIGVLAWSALLFFSSRDKSPYSRQG